MEKEKIAIDIDETLLEFLEGLSAFYKKHHEPTFNLSKDDISSYSFEEIFNIDSERVRALFTEFKHTPFFKNLSIVEGAKEAILDLSRTKDIFFITARPMDLNHATKKQIDALFPKNNFKIIHSHDNNNNKIKEKTEFCKELKINTIIEDDLGVALGCTKEELNCFLIDKPWNKHHEEHPNIIRVKNWQEIMERLK